MYEEVTANFILSCEKLKLSLYYKLVAKIGALPISIQHNTKSPSQRTQVRKRNKRFPKQEKE